MPRVLQTTVLDVLEGHGDRIRKSCMSVNMCEDGGNKDGFTNTCSLVFSTT